MSEPTIQERLRGRRGSVDATFSVRNEAADRIDALEAKEQNNYDVLAQNAKKIQQLKAKIDADAERIAGLENELEQGE